VVAARNTDGLIDDLERIASSLEDLDLRTSALRGTDVDGRRDRVVRTIRSYLIPRLNEPERPLSVVFAGPTGSGKSTLINSVSGLDVSKTGPVRPTTSSPVILTSEPWQGRFESIAGLECHVVAGTAPILDELAFIDTPDIDSTSETNRLIAEALIDSADVVVFVTSSLRYADLVPWEVLRRAVSRGAPVVNVLNRVTSESAGAVVDFKRRLAEAGLSDAVVRVPEHHLGGAGQAVPAVAVRGLRRRLARLAEDRRQAQAEVTSRVMATAIEEADSLGVLVESDRAWVEDWEGRVQQALRVAASSLDLAAVVGEVAVEGATPRTRWGRRRWLRDNRMTPQTVDEFCRSARSALVAGVATHIRHAVVELGLIELVGIDLANVSRDVSTLVGVAFDEWTGSVQSDVSVLNSRDRPLGRITVMASALGGGDRVAGAMLFGLDRDRMIRESRQELDTRLQVVYDHVARKVIRDIRNAAGAPEAELLAERARRAVVSSTFAYA